MIYKSTRNEKNNVSLSTAILEGLAKDGGLFVPEYLPKIDISKINPDGEFYKLAYEVIRPFADGDIIEDELLDVCKSAFDFPIELSFLYSNDKAILELYHGPTSAFKDFGARFLASIMSAILSHKHEHKTILVATSGDTGSAVGSAFHNKKNIDVIILYPKGLVSSIQQAQLTSFDNNVKTMEVNGTFDDCQKMVKDAFVDRALDSKYNFSSANSINIARLLAQMTYYFYASIKFYNKSGKKPIIIVPTGNAGNVCAALWAKSCGAPIHSLFLSCNSNHSISDYIRTGKFSPHPTIVTLANAMDIGAPSNMERLMALYPSFYEFRSNINAESVDDDKIKSTIKDYYARYNKFICPHTACAVYSDKTHFDGLPTIVVSTADAAKFANIYEDLLGTVPPMNDNLKKMINHKQNYKNIDKGYKNIFREG